MQTQCANYTSDDYDTAQTFPHDLLSLHPWNIAPISTSTWLVPDTQKYVRTNEPEFQFVNVGEPGRKPSITALYRVPAISVYTKQSLLACIVDARWIPITTWIDPNVDMFVHDSKPSVFDVLETAYAKGSNLQYPQIKIPEAWANSLDTAVGNTLVAENVTSQSIGLAPLSKCTTLTGRASSYMHLRYCLAMSLLLYIADGIARYQSVFPLYKVDEYAQGSNQSVVMILE